MSSESTLKDLPKVDSVLKEQLEGFSPDKLKKTDTAEKTALPTKEGELFCWERERESVGEGRENASYVGSVRKRSEKS